ncbi:sulfur carrier protein [Catenibacillus scindens]|uniref:Sulfur carrier protein n=1 Tax=Catenibacillus scindens TaxID=673271 RepID=A0A7W8H8B4_9FIRM|nr:sulfur carrier protein ThiS [Catenibacillus scindens]MBB5263358.1 sulfur carrier protein [Catenibacillus scindens]
MKVNGKIYSLAQPLSLKDFLEEKGFNSDRVAVELNGDIIPKGAYETTMLSDADTLEVVHFVGGG